MPELIVSFVSTHPDISITATYSSSGTALQQVRRGAPVDAVVLASPLPVGTLIKEGFADKKSQRSVATNRLVLAGPENSKPLSLSQLDSLAADQHLAIGDPHLAPVGQYARVALRRAGLWESVQNNLVLGRNVAMVLAYVRRGEVRAGIVYETDVRGMKDAVILDTLDDAPLGEVVAAVTATTERRRLRAAEFVDFLTTPTAVALFSKHGFGPSISSLNGEGG
jgi:molybdate transport system substrate-binding protein